MNVSRHTQPPKKAQADKHPADWDVRRVLGDNDDSKYRAYEPPARQPELAAVGRRVRCVCGVFTCVIILALANRDESSSFLVYLAVRQRGCVLACG